MDWPGTITAIIGGVTSLVAAGGAVAIGLKNKTVNEDKEDLGRVRELYDFERASGHRHFLISKVYMDLCFTLYVLINTDRVKVQAIFSELGITNPIEWAKIPPLPDVDTMYPPIKAPEDHML